MFHIIGQLIVGLIIGVMARFLFHMIEGKAQIEGGPIGWLITAGIGIAGAFVGSLIGRMIWKEQGYTAGWILSIVTAVILMTLARFIFHIL